jgi:hypothetical protein
MERCDQCAHFNPTRNVCRKKRYLWSNPAKAAAFWARKTRSKENSISSEWSPDDGPWLISQGELSVTPEFGCVEWVAIVDRKS